MPLIKAGTPLPKTADESNKESGSIARADKQYEYTEDVKGRRIQRSGLYQAALQSVGVVQHSTGSFENYLANVQKAAEAGLKWVNE